MQLTNRVAPNQQQMKEFLEAGHDGPACMLDLLKSKDRSGTAA